MEVEEKEAEKEGDGQMESEEEQLMDTGRDEGRYLLVGGSREEVDADWHETFEGALSAARTGDSICLKNKIHVLEQRLAIRKKFELQICGLGDDSDDITADNKTDGATPDREKREKTDVAMAHDESAQRADARHALASGPHGTANVRPMAPDGRGAEMAANLTKGEVEDGDAGDQCSRCAPLVEGGLDLCVGSRGHITSLDILVKASDGVRHWYIHALTHTT